MKSLVVVFVVFIVALLGGAYLYLFNPTNLFLKKSEAFDKEVFMSFDVGADIVEVIEALGKPVSTKTDSETTEIGQREVRIYVFMGEAPDWLFAYEKAWIVTDSNGTILARYLYQEP